MLISYAKQAFLKEKMKSDFLEREVLFWLRALRISVRQDLGEQVTSFISLTGAGEKKIGRIF